LAVPTRIGPLDEEDVMRIDRGPSLAEIRASVAKGAIVTFSNVHGEQVRGKVLDAKVHPGTGRVALMLEEERTGLIWFARYRYGSVRWSCGDIATWNLTRSEIENLPEDVAAFKCYGA
jgi:hypothetical protein